VKILQVNCVYKKGSTGKITYDIHTELLKSGIESIVCYGRGKKINEEYVYKTCGELYSKANHLASRFSGVMYGGCYFSTKKLIHIIQKEKPDIVHLQCINGYFVNIYRLIKWLKDNDIRTVVTLHAEFMYTGGCGHSFDCNQWSNPQGCAYFLKCPRWRAETQSMFFDRTATMWKRMKEAFNGFDNKLVVTSVSPWLMNRALMSPIFSGKEHKVVLNGLDTAIFHIYQNSKIKKELGLKNEKIIFHATPDFNLNPQHIKGGYYVNELAKRLSNKNVKILIAGPYSKDIQVAGNVILLGHIKKQERLAELYSLADVTLLASKRETFSMVTAESLSCGTPVVGFKSGAPEQIAIQEYSCFVDYGDVEALVGAVENMFLKKIEAIDISEKASQKYGKNVMCQNYIQIYKDLYMKY
jgi:putative colanic acid biosynthesis glycosyltransferase